MSRHIDADLLIADIQRYLCANCSIHCNPSSFKNSACEIAECLRMIDNAPTDDVPDVKQGHWEFYGKLGNIREYFCSECNEVISSNKPPYCMNCGAKMYGGKQ